MAPAGPQMMPLVRCAGGSLRQVTWRIGPAGDRARVDFHYEVNADVDLLGVMWLKRRTSRPDASEVMRP